MLCLPQNPSRLVIMNDLEKTILSKSAPSKISTFKCVWSTDLSPELRYSPLNSPCPVRLGYEEIHSLLKRVKSPFSRLFISGNFCRIGGRKSSSSRFSPTQSTEVGQCESCWDLISLHLDSGLLLLVYKQ